MAVRVATIASVLQRQKNCSAFAAVTGVEALPRGDESGDAFTIICLNLVKSCLATQYGKVAERSLSNFSFTQ